MKSITVSETVDIDVPVYELVNQLDVDDFVTCFYCLDSEDREAVLQEISGNGISKEVIKSLITTLERHGLHEMLIDLADLANEISHQTNYPVLTAIKQLERGMTKTMTDIDTPNQTEELDLDNMDDLLDCFDGETVEGGVDSENDIGCEGGACKL